MKEQRNRNVKAIYGIGIATLLCVLMVCMSWSTMVINSDINSESAVVTETQDTKIGEVDGLAAEKEATSFEAENFPASRGQRNVRYENRDQDFP